jgi:hypothetical protein
MKKILLALSVMIIVSLVFTSVHAQRNLTTGEARTAKTGEAQATSGNKKILIVYFSRTGNTREIAHQIHRIVGGDISEIQTVNPYPADYEEVKKTGKTGTGIGF